MHFTFRKFKLDHQLSQNLTRLPYGQQVSVRPNLLGRHRYFAAKCFLARRPYFAFILPCHLIFCHLFAQIRGKNVCHVFENGQKVGHMFAKWGNVRHMNRKKCIWAMTASKTPGSDQTWERNIDILLGLLATAFSRVFDILLEELLANLAWPYSRCNKQRSCDPVMWPSHVT